MEMDKWTHFRSRVDRQLHRRAELSSDKVTDLIMR